MLRQVSLGVALVALLAACAGKPMQSQEASLSTSQNAPVVSAAEDSTVTSTSTQVSSSVSTQDQHSGSYADAHTVGQVQTITQNGIVLTVPVIIAGTALLVLLGWLIPAPRWFSAFFGRGRL